MTTRLGYSIVPDVVAISGNAPNVVALAIRISVLVRVLPDLDTP